MSDLKKQILSAVEDDLQAIEQGAISITPFTRLHWRESWSCSWSLP